MTEGTLPSSSWPAVVGWGQGQRRLQVVTTCPAPLPGETEPGFPGKEVLLEDKAWVRALSSPSTFWGAAWFLIASPKGSHTQDV